MFTGLIEALGKVTAVRKMAAGMVLSIDVGVIIQTNHKRDACATLVGDSINVNGVCLTVSKLSGSTADCRSGR